MKKFYAILIGVLVCLVTILGCLFLYNFDNKYTALGPRGNQGILTLDETLLREYPLVFLIDGWAYHSDSLLTPESFSDNKKNTPTDYIFIGEMSGFEVNSRSGSPHGSASYHLIIEVPEEPATYALELPEIFSAYKLYINGELMAQMGNTDAENYWPQTGNRIVSIEGSGEIDILFAVSDYSHLYSGLVYPPAFGLHDEVLSLLNGRLFLRTVLCTIIGTIGLLAVLFGFLSREKKLPILYGVLCLLLIGYISYPVVRTFFFGFQPQYLIESISFSGVLLVVMFITRNIYGSKNRWGLIPISFGIFMCLFSLVLPVFLLKGNLDVMHLYSNLISIYEWIVALFITVIAFRVFSSNSGVRKFLFYGILVFDMALIMDRVLPLHEPIWIGWFIELASFILVVCIGIVIGRDVAVQYREASILAERNHSMKKLYEAQQSYFTVLREEKKEVKKIHHDIRHHLIVVSGFIENKQYDKLSAYITGVQFPLSLAKEYCTIDVINILSYHFDVLAKRYGIKFDIRCDLKNASTDDLKVSESDLCSVYANLIENALEACLRTGNEGGVIQVAIVRPTNNYLTIYVWNSGEKDSIPMRGQSSKKKGRIGYGLLSVNSIIEKYDGTYEFSWDEEKKLFKSEVSLEAFK